MIGNPILVSAIFSQIGNAVACEFWRDAVRIGAVHPFAAVPAFVILRAHEKWLEEIMGNIQKSAMPQLPNVLE